MATLVFFHAHPDDESIATGGTMAKAADEGHRVVLVVATAGERGELLNGALTDGETLAKRRIAETAAAAEVLGVARVEFLGYTDSGMAGEASNHEPGVFAAAAVPEAAARLSTILAEESAEVLTCYDDHGGYGHPDHVQVHRVGMAAGQMAATPRIYQATMSRDRLAEQAARAGGSELPPEAAETWGTPEAQISTVIDVAPWLQRKRAAMRAHASQISPESFFLALPDEAFAYAFGTEWYLRVDAPNGQRESDLLGPAS